MSNFWSTIKIIFFVLATVLLAFRSRKSLQSIRCHGFFRFFAFETILILVLLNVPYWFRDAFSLRQLCSWLLLLIAIFLASHGFYLLHQIGKPRGNFEATTVLVRTGAYRYIRHPLYASLLDILWGAFLKQVSIVRIILVLAGSLFLFLTAKIEERENLQKFGPDYQHYQDHTKMMIPFLW